MRYLGHGIGHQNQDARWTQAGLEDDGMDVDPAPEEDINLGGSVEDDPTSQIQGLQEMAMKLASQTAGDDDEQIHSDEDSENEDDDGSDDDDLFHDDDDESSEDGDVLDFGPDDGEGEDDEEADVRGDDYF